MQDKKVLVVGAHTADWLWRSGGTVAKYIAHGAEVHVVCLTYGARGESNELWKDPNQTLENVKKIRYEETIAAAKVLGVKNIEIWDYEDHIFQITPERLERMMVKIRQVRPNIILAHDLKDILNPDHAIASEFVWLASRMANSAGIITEGLKTTPQMAIYGFEQSQTEQSDFKPSVYIDITETWEKKLEAMNCIKAQLKTIEVHKRVNTHRGWQARSLSGNKDIAYAEAFSSRYPVVYPEFPCR